MFRYKVINNFISKDLCFKLINDAGIIHDDSFVKIQTNRNFLSSSSIYFNELKELYSSSTAQEQHELRNDIQEMIDEGPERMNGGKRKMTRKKKSKSKKSKKSKSKKSRNPPSYRSMLKLISS